jgi:hypothetical protein
MKNYERRFEMEKSKKILLPIAIILAVLIVLMLVLTVSEAVTGNARPTSDGAATVEESTQGAEEGLSTDYIYDYQMQDYSVSSGITYEAPQADVDDEETDIENQTTDEEGL